MTITVGLRKFEYGLLDGRAARRDMLTGEVDIFSRAAGQKDNQNAWHRTSRRGARGFMPWRH